MIWIALGILIPLFFCARYAWLEGFKRSSYNRRTDWYEVGVASLIFVFTSIIGVLCGILISLILGYFVGEPPRIDGREDIILMADGSTTSGSFYLFGGYIDDDPSFSFYSKDDKGRISLQSVPAEDSVIIEEGEASYVNTDCPGEAVLTLLWVSEDTSDCKYEFHIPAGTIKNQIVLDGE